jgi:CBS domain containing-hemolysin-like protein
MVPRPEVVAISIALPPPEALKSVLESPYTRYPVYRESLDDIVGVLHIRDLIEAMMQETGIAGVDLEQLVRPAYMVPETKDLASLLTEFRRTNQHMAVVIDEYGSMEGIVTLEDLLEEIVGEIQDEYDTEEPLVERLSDDEARIDGRADVDDLTDLFGIQGELEDADEYDTVGGLIYHRIGGVPKPGDQVQVNGLTLTVETTDGRRVGKVLVVRTHHEGEPQADDDDR